MANTEAEYRKERVEKNRDTDNLITEKKGEGNIFEEQVFDVLEYLEKESKTGNNSIARKILKLKEYGITDEEIVTRYNDKAGTRETTETVASILESVFVDLVDYINDIPNGIWIRPETAEIDEDKSFEDAIKAGILSEDSIVESVDKFLVDTLKEIGLTFDKSTSENVNYVLENFGREYINYNDFDKDVIEFLNKDEKDMNLSEFEKNISRRNKEIISNSPYEKDLKLFEISKLEILWRTATDENEKELYRKQVINFYKKNPKYATKKIPVLNADGKLNIEEVRKMNEYSEAYEKTIILRHFEQFNNMSKEELLQLPADERNHFFMCAFSALKYKNDLREDERELANRAMEIIKQLEPNLDLNNEQELANFFQKLDGREMNLERLSLDEMIEIYYRQLSFSAEKYIIENQESFINDKDIDLSDLNMDLGRRKIFDSTMKNYFVGSKIKFSEKDEALYNQMTQEFTIGAWIENKEDAIRLRYTALLKISKY